MNHIIWWERSCATFSVEMLGCRPARTFTCAEQLRRIFMALVMFFLHRGMSAARRCCLVQRAGAEDRALRIKPPLSSSKWFRKQNHDSESRTIWEALKNSRGCITWPCTFDILPVCSTFKEKTDKAGKQGRRSCYAHGKACFYAHDLHDTTSNTDSAIM